MKTESNNPDKKIELSAQNKTKQSKGSFNSFTWVFLSIVLVCIVITGYVLYTNYQQTDTTIALQEQYEMLQNDLSSRDSLINEWVIAFQDIEADLSAMRKKENILFNHADDPEFSSDMRQRILDDIQSLNTLLKENKEKAAALDKKLKQYGVKIAALQDQVKTLESDLAVRDSSIKNLKM